MFLFVILPITHASLNNTHWFLFFKLYWCEVVLLILLCVLLFYNYKNYHFDHDRYISAFGLHDFITYCKRIYNSYLVSNKIQLHHRVSILDMCVYTHINQVMGTERNTRVHLLHHMAMHFSCSRYQNITE